MLWNVMPEPSTSTPSSRSGASASPMRRCACGRAAGQSQVAHAPADTITCQHLHHRMQT